MEQSMFLARILKAGVAAAFISGAALVSSLPAAAGSSTGTWRNGMVEGPYGPGYYGRGYEGRGPYGHAYGYHRNRHDGWRHRDWGDDEADCRIVRRRIVNSWGDVIIRREEICD